MCKVLDFSSSSYRFTESLCKTADEVDFLCVLLTQIGLELRSKVLP